MLRNLMFLLSVYAANSVMAIATPQEELFAAVEAGNLSEVQRLLHEGECEVNAVNHDGYTTLHLAVNSYAATTEDEAEEARRILVVIGILLKCGANPGAVSRMGRTPLYLAAFYGRVPVIEALVAVHANPNAEDILGLTPLHVAASSGCLAAVAFLLSHGGNPNAAATGQGGQTVLHAAAEGGMPEVLLGLLNAGADVNAVDSHGDTALHVAAGVGNDVQVQHLLDFGANPAVLDQDDETPMQIADANRRIGVVAILRPVLHWLNSGWNHRVYPPRSNLIQAAAQGKISSRMVAQLTPGILLVMLSLIRNFIPEELILYIFKSLKNEDLIGFATDAVNKHKKYFRKDGDDEGGPSNGGARGVLPLLH